MSIYNRGRYPYPPTLAYTPCCTPVPGVISTATGNITVSGQNNYLTESSRVQAQECPTAYISNARVPVQSGNVPYVDVITTPASATQSAIANSNAILANDPYNPATRFSQYRFAYTVIPPPPPCPVAVPNPTTVGICSPPTMFRGSVQNVGPT